MSSPTRTPLPTPGSELQLEVSGMTCASCANRVELKLNRVPGVAATVNYATGRAAVRLTAPVPVETLISTIEQAGYGASVPTPERPHDPDAELPRLRARLVVAAALALPVLLLAMVPAWQLPGWQWLSLLLTLPVVGWAGWPFHRAAAVNLRHGAATMDTLVSMGTLAALAWSAYALLVGGAGRIGFTHPFELMLSREDGAENLYLEAAAVITAFILLGRYLEARTRRRSGAAVRALLELTPQRVRRLRAESVDGDGVEEEVEVAALRVGDRFAVRPGERVATDGQVVSGHTAVDASAVTGESVPVERGPGDPVVGGEINTYGALVVEATRVGADTQLAQIARLVEAAQTGKARVQRLADRISGVFVPVVITLALATLVGWLAAGADTSFAVAAAVAVLIIACPCALGLATPTALLVGTGRGARLGVLVRGPEALESARRIDTVVLDKTGTLTHGRMAVVAVVPGAGTAEAGLLRVAGAAEAGSEHPVARAILDRARTAGPLSAVSGFRNVPERGVVATLPPTDLSGAPAALATGGSDRSPWTAVVGRPELLEAEGLAVGEDVRAAYAAEQARGRTVVLVGWAGSARGVLAVADTVKPTSAEAVRALRGLGLRPILLTGDARVTAEAVAREVGIEEVVAEVLPTDKVAAVAELQRAGRRVAMVGDGVNDAAALAQADLGIAMGTGTDAAIEASDLTLLRGDLGRAADAVRLARATLRTIRANLFWAFAYNVAAIPLAALGFLNPMLAALAMAFSSVFVVGNSLTLLRFRPRHG